VRDFRYLQPTTLQEAIELLQQYGDDAKAMAGGQSLVLLMREGLVQSDVVVSLLKIPGLDGIVEADGAVNIGGLATHRQVEASPVVREHFPFIYHAYQALASVPVRNLATLGGNLCHNAPGSDPPPLLIALDATVTLRGPDGERTLTVEEFGTNYYETALRPAEILRSVTAPMLPPHTAMAYYKYAIRPMDMALVAVAVRVTLEPGSDRCRDVRVALSGVAPSTIRARQVEDALRGRDLSEPVIAGAAALAAVEVDPISDIHGSADYRRRLAIPAARRMVQQAWQSARMALTG